MQISKYTKVALNFWYQKPDVDLTSLGSTLGDVTSLILIWSQKCLTRWDQLCLQTFPSYDISWVVSNWHQQYLTWWYQKLDTKLTSKSICLWDLLIFSLGPWRQDIRKWYRFDIKMVHPNDIWSVMKLWCWDHVSYMISHLSCNSSLCWHQNPGMNLISNCSILIMLEIWYEFVIKTVSLSEFWNVLSDTCTF